MSLREEKEYANSGKQKVSVREGDQCSFRHEGNDRAKPTPKAAPPLSHNLQKHEVEVCREKRNARGRSQSDKFNRPPCKYFLKVLAPNRFVTIGILPNVSFIRLKWDVNSAQSAHFRTGRLGNIPTKGRRRMVTKVQ